MTAPLVVELCDILDSKYDLVGMMDWEPIVDSILTHLDDLGLLKNG